MVDRIKFGQISKIYRDLGKCSFEKKKKLRIFPTGGGGQDKLSSFSQLFFIFFKCPNSCKYAKKKIFHRGAGIPY